MINKRHCRYHQKRKSVLYCEKYEYGYCEECLETRLACSDPEEYCKFRTHCVIWENCRTEMKKIRASGE